MTHQLLRRLLAPLVGIVVFLGAWELLVRTQHVRPFVLRAPSRIVHYLGQQAGDYTGAAWVTIQHAMIGTAFALLVALLIGSAMAASSFFEHAAQPVLTLLQVTPFVAYIASVVLWLGSGTKPAVFIVALVCMPAFTFATVDGMRGADPAARELLASVDATRWEVLWRLRLPSAMPSLFTTARYNVGLALIAAYLVEGGNFANEGLGAIGKRAAAFNKGDALWAAVFSMALLGTISLVLISVAQRLVMHWHVSQRRQLR
ncbi:MAG: ABC transporter permease subunit [Actinomycetota bacterium]|nr:ABC transporter permease subunit [Actinomycetota bacterium]